MRKIKLAVLAGIVAAFVVVAGTIARGQPATTPNSRPVPAATTGSAPATSVDASAATGDGDRQRNPIMFGATGQYKWEIQQREKELGKKVEAVRVFRRWGQPLFTEHQLWARDTGHTIFVSIKSRQSDGTTIGWRDIANAEPGSRLHDEMLRQARQLQDFGATVYVTFNHEPDARTSRPMGEPEDFVAAWRKLIDTYREADVTNARYVWVMTEPAFDEDALVAKAYYPGDAYVDHIGVDAYNWLGCMTPANEGDGRWRSPASILDGHRRFGERHPGKGLMVLEWGSVEDPDRPGRKAQWIREATELFRKPGWAQYRAIMHYDARSLREKQSPCDFDYRSSAGAFDAWRGMGRLPAYAADSPCDIARLAREHLDSLARDADDHKVTTSRSSLPRECSRSGPAAGR